MKPKRWRTGVRWMKFNLVGAMGIAVQLAVLWMLIGLGLEYMLATIFAVESAVLHNFVWHERFTWADRPGKRGLQVAGRLFRFNLTTGAVSIGGNLVLMRLLVGEAHFRPVMANLISIAACSLVNFLVSDRWVFRAPAVAGRRKSGLKGLVVIPQDVVPIRNVAILSRLLPSGAKDGAVSPRLGNRYG